MHILRVHHGSKAVRGGADQILDPAAIVATIDQALRLRIPPGSQTRLLYTVQRYGVPIPETVLRFDLVTRTSRLGKRRNRAEIASIGWAILTFVRQQAVPPTEAAIDQDVSGKTAYRRQALSQLMASDEVTRAGAGGKKELFRDTLASRS
jgi:hypothetical protein